VNVEARLDALESRLAALEAERDEGRRGRAVLEALLRYSRCIDIGDEAGWVGCFTDDGVFEVRPLVAGVQGQRVEGREALEAFAAGHTGPPAVHHKHAYLMPEIEVDGDHASASGYLVHLVDVDGKPLVQSFGRYLDTLVADTDGAWRISERVVEVEAHVGAIH